jgi:hypothetical protein
MNIGQRIAGRAVALDSHNFIQIDLVTEHSDKKAKKNKAFQPCFSVSRDL